MQEPAGVAPVSRPRLWAGIGISALTVLFLLFDGAVKLTDLEAVVEANQRLGYSMSLARWIGIIELLCTILYAFPRTSILGAVLLTGFLGGATATHVRIGDVFMFPIVVGLLTWGGVFLREVRLGALIPLRSEGAIGRK